MSRTMLALSLCAAASWTAACTSSSQNVTAPSASKCAVTISATPTTFSASGGNGTLTISTNRECQWSASAAASWIQLGQSAGGQGDSTLQFTVRANADPSVRKAAIGVGDQQVGITQEAAPCTFSLSPGRDSVAASGGQKSIDVKASSPQCTWTARSGADWLTIVDGSTGSGSGTVRYTALATTGPARSGTLDIAGQSVTIAQASGCKYAIAPSSQAFGTTGGSGAIAVTAVPGCTWTAAADASWLAITAGASGGGPGTIAFRVAASEMGIPARTGTIAVSDQIFTASQAAGPACVYTLGATSQEFPPLPGGIWSFSVATGRFCAWTVSSSVPWLTISRASGRTGTGAVVFTIAPNPPGSPARIGIIALQNGQSYTVIQDASP